MVCRPFTRNWTKMRPWRASSGRPYRRVIRQDASWFQVNTHKTRLGSGCQKWVVISLHLGMGAFRTGSPSPGARQGKAPWHAPGCDDARERSRPTPSARDRIDSAHRSRPSHRPPAGEGATGRDGRRDHSRQGETPAKPAKSEGGLKAEPRREGRCVAPGKIQPSLGF
jgi:hypothetical protein